ncbi:MAG TPA: DeoR/GlpR transcriptional regulator, partial [Rhodobacterales bacterium]|nr:DeoR/GlpR transcriptional regulator [Rhodobacterales bacterium]
ERSQRRPGRRRAQICEHLARKGSVSVEELSEQSGASPETIRRDLTALAESGRLRKVHGGARALEQAGEGEMQARMRENVLAKQVIAEKAAALVTPGSVLFIDTGSTTLFAARELARIRRLTVITNSLDVATTLAGGSGGAQVFLLGGAFRAGNAQSVGAEAVQQAGLYHADMALLTVAALSTQGAMDYSAREAQLARAMIANAETCAIMADHSKLKKQATHRVCALSQVDYLLTDRTPQENLKESLKKNRVSLG